MTLITKYNIGDKVWFYVEESNTYAWGEISEVQLRATDKKRKIDYVLPNRFYKESSWLYISSKLEGERFLSFSESELFENLGTLKDQLETTHRHKIDAMVEHTKKRKT